MPAPTAATYSVAALIAAHTSFRDLIDSGSGPGKIKIRTASDVLLGEIVLTKPCGSVSGTTGRLTFTFATQEDSAGAGNAAYGEFCDSDGDVHLALPAVEGTTPVPGFIVFNTLVVTADGPIDVLSATVG